MPSRGGSAHINDFHTMAANLLAAASQRYTANRRRLVEILDRSDGPLTIAGILAGRDGLAQSSTYRNLAVLEEAGVVQRIVTSDDHARFELTETITGQHHHHLICAVCGTVFDVTLPPTIENGLVACLGERAAALGFEGDHHRVDLVGTCSRCRS